MRNGIVFDMDGVLFDSGPYHFESWKQLAAEDNIRGVDWEWFLNSFGRKSKEIIEDLLGREVSDEEVRRMEERKESLYRDAARGHVTAPPGLPALIHDLARRGWAIGIGSSGPRENVDLIIEELNLGGIVSVSVSANDVKRGKPDPEVFLKAAEGMRVRASCCVVVEDAPVGVQAARAAGMKCIAITTSQPAANLTGADRVIDSFEELTAEDVERLLDGRATAKEAAG